MFIRSVPLEGGTCDQPEAGALGTLLDAAPSAGLDLPCRSGDADLWFAESPAVGAGNRRSGGARVGGGTSGGRSSAALPLLLVPRLRRPAGARRRWSVPGSRTKKKAADPGFGFRGLEEDR